MINIKKKKGKHYDSINIYEQKDLRLLSSSNSSLFIINYVEYKFKVELINKCNQRPNISVFIGVQLYILNKV